MATRHGAGSSPEQEKPETKFDLLNLLWIRQAIRYLCGIAGLDKRSLLADKARLGRWGEKRGERFLKRKGLKPLTRNFLCKTGEIDLIMVDNEGTLVFVEVKTRANEDFGPSESAVTGTKRARMIRAARYFLATHEIEDRPYRFDVVTIVLAEKGPAEVRYYQSAFVP